MDLHLPGGGRGRSRLYQFFRMHPGRRHRRRLGRRSGDRSRSLGGRGSHRYRPGRNGLAQDIFPRTLRKRGQSRNHLPQTLYLGVKGHRRTRTVDRNQLRIHTHRIPEDTHTPEEYIIHPQLLPQGPGLLAGEGAFYLGQGLFHHLGIYRLHLTRGKKPGNQHVLNPFLHVGKILSGVNPEGKDGDLFGDPSPN